MNLDFLKDVGKQLVGIWRDIKTHQKFTVVLVILFLLGLMSFFVVNAATTRFASLFPGDRLLVSDAAEIKEYLDGARIEYKIKGDSLILVPSNMVHRIRMDLAAVGLPRKHSGKGFELFDTNTWIKGEKEIQVLEMRALKGQLERDVVEYENIRGANVILDIAPPRPFGGSMYKTKASVILELMPGARLSQSQLRAITFHISGAVRGLVPNMVAISDTSGKLYQSIDPDGEVDMLRSAEVATEERIKSKVDGMLSLVVGLGNYYSTVQVRMKRQKTSKERKVYSGVVDGTDLGEPVIASVTESGLELSEKEKAEQGTPGTNTEAVAGAVAREEFETLNRSESRNQQHRQLAVPVDHIKVLSTPGQIESISVGVLIDKTITIDDGADLPEEDIVEGRRNTEKLKEEIEHQLAKILEGYGTTTEPAVDFVEFDKTRFNEKQQEETWSTVIETAIQVGTGLFIILTVLGMFWTFNRFWKRHMMQPPSLDRDDEEDEELQEEPSLVEVEAMFESIKQRIQHEPKIVLETIRDWLNEEDDESGR